MAVRFAGSRSVDERRRRRLASEEEPAQSVAVPPRQPKEEPTESESLPTSSGGLTIQRLVPNTAWPFTVAVLIGLLCFGGLLFADTRLQHGGWESDSPVVDAVLADVATRTPGLVAFTSTMALVFAAQIALLIGWIRSRNPTDFGGRYRIWLWGATACLIAAVDLATGLTQLLAAHAESLTPIYVAQLRMLSLMLIPLLLGTVLLGGLHGEMSECRVSLAFLWLAAAGLLVQVGWGAGIRLTGPPAWTHLAIEGARLGSHFFVLMSFAFHLRFVTHVSSAPPEVVTVAGNEKPKAVSQRRDVDQDIESARDQAEPLVAASVEPNDAKRAVEEAPAARATDQHVEEEALASPPHEDEPSAPPPKRRTPKKAAKKPEPIAQTQRTDAAHRNDQLKGLSKRERRRLRKQWREEDRVDAEN